MTHEQIDQMLAGSEMDALVAEKIMNWRVYFRNTAWWVEAELENGLVDDWTQIKGRTCGNERFAPSTNVADAWKVVEKLKFNILPIEPGWGAGTNIYIDDDIWANASTAPLAICRAGLKAIMKEIENA